MIAASVACIVAALANTARAGKRAAREIAPVAPASNSLDSLMSVSIRVCRDAGSAPSVWGLIVGRSGRLVDYCKERLFEPGGPSEFDTVCFANH